MFVDVVKYIITVGILGGLLTDKLTPEMAVIWAITTLGFLLGGFLIIPEVKKKVDYGSYLYSFYRHRNK